jgi:hypothetical protein
MLRRHVLGLAFGMMSRCKKNAVVKNKSLLEERRQFSGRSQWGMVKEMKCDQERRIRSGGRGLWCDGCLLGLLAVSSSFSLL